MATGRRVGYVRVSTLDRTFTDKVSGRDTRRPQPAALLAFVREGDTVLVHSMDRLARTLGELCRPPPPGAYASSS